MASADLKRCKAGDPKLKLKMVEQGKKSFFFANTDADLQSMCECTSIDYAFIMNCEDCSDDTLSKCRLAKITGKDRINNWSIFISNAPKITTLASFSKVAGPLVGGIYIGFMAELKNLDGLEGITEAGIDQYGHKIFLGGLDNLESATALRKISVNAGMLAISHNPKLACVPADWPEKDGDGNTVREGGACTTEEQAGAAESVPAGRSGHGEL